MFGSGKEIILQNFFGENTACSLKNPISLMFHLDVLVFLLVGWANVGTEIKLVEFTQARLKPHVSWWFHGAFIHFIPLKGNPQHVIT